MEMDNRETEVTITRSDGSKTKAFIHGGGDGYVYLRHAGAQEDRKAMKVLQDAGVFNFDNLKALVTLGPGGDWKSYAVPIQVAKEIFELRDDMDKLRGDNAAKEEWIKVLERFRERDSEAVAEIARENTRLREDEKELCADIEAKANRIRELVAENETLEEELETAHDETNRVRMEAFQNLNDVQDSLRTTATAVGFMADRSCG